VKVLVTGATGFVGWHTAARLHAAGHALRALVRDRGKASAILAPFDIAADDLVVGDMADADAVARGLDGCNAVVHAAAAVSVTAPGASDAFDINVTGTRHVIGGAWERGIERVVFVSSLSAIYDPRSSEPVRADSPLVHSATRYGRSKAAADRTVRELQEGGAPIATVYPSGVIGPDDPGMSESVRAYRTFLRGTIRAGGTQFVDARDLADFHVRLLEAGAGGRHVAAGHYFSWDELTALIEDITGASIRRFPAPGWLLRASGSVADVASRVTGRRSVVTRESMEVATRWRAIDNSPSLSAMGVSLRPPRQTLEDLYRSFLETNRLPAHAAPKLASAPAG
jgi:nucleoside-diphosphate-sugar epimerase